MRSWALRFLSHSYTALLCVAMMVQPVQADPMVDFIIEHFQEQCDAEQADFRGIDDDLDALLQGVLSLSEDAIYDIALTPDGVRAQFSITSFTAPISDTAGAALAAAASI